MKVILNLETNYIETGGIRRPMTLEEYIELLCENCIQKDAILDLTIDYGHGVHESMFLCEDCAADIVRGRMQINRKYIYDQIKDETLSMYVMGMEISIF